MQMDKMWREQGCTCLMYSDTETSSTGLSSVYFTVSISELQIFNIIYNKIIVVTQLS